MNNVICSAPFVHLHVDKNGDVLPCCGAQDRTNTLFGNIKNKSIKEIYSGDVINKFRSDLLNGVPSKACEGCYQIEKNGGDSYRKWFNKTYPVENEQVEIKYVDIRFSNFCNFKCRMCDGESSSSIKSESFKLNNITNQTAIIELDKVKVFDFLNEHLNSIDKIYFAGGEPLIMEEHYELLDLLITNNKTDITLSYNTNLSTLTYKDKSVIELWSKFKIVELYASLDGIFEIGEYIRDGLNYKKFEDNIFSIIKNCKHVTTSINICVNIFNVFHLFEMLPYVYEKGILNPINFTINILTTPYYQSVTVLPNELKVKWVERLEDFKTKYNGIEYTKIRHELDVIKNYMLSKDDSEYIKQFNDNVIKYDLIRNKDFFKLYNNLQPIV
jgi:radical SAM protein with 4Fe4S-binding SPASM domain